MHHPTQPSARLGASVYGEEPPDAEIMAQAEAIARLGPCTVGNENDAWSRIGNKPVCQSPPEDVGSETE